MRTEGLETTVGLLLMNLWKRSIQDSNTHQTEKGEILTHMLPGSERWDSVLEILQCGPVGDSVPPA